MGKIVRRLGWERLFGGVLLAAVMLTIALRLQRGPSLLRSSECVDARCRGYSYSDKLQSNSSEIRLASSVSESELVRYRGCSEALYRCGRATLVFVHVHKGGGTTFVTMARYNNAGLARHERNGDPVLEENRYSRDEWWRLPPGQQARWFHQMRRKDGIRFVATEKGFPSTHNLLAPSGLVYAIVIRNPVSRFVSYYFWRYRDKSVIANIRALATSYISSAFRPAVASLQSAAPTFAEFIQSEMPLDGYYLRRLLGIDDPKYIVDTNHLDQAKSILEHVFSLILITEHLSDFGPLLAKTLGWQYTNFAQFYQKANPPPDLEKLISWTPRWREEIRHRMPLDSDFYLFAKDLSELRSQRIVGDFSYSE